ncbi:MAG: preprotein translocase subunit SecD [Nanoarchaeota archaeon]
MDTLSKFKEIFSSWRVWMLIIFILCSVAAINPKFDAKGVEIVSVDTNSSAEINGVRAGDVLKTINDNPILTIEDFNKQSSVLQSGQVVKISTGKGTYSFLAETKDGAVSAGFSVDKVPTSNLKQGLDLIGGVRVLLKPDAQLTDQQFSDLVSITQKRLNVYGLRDMNVKQVSDFEGNKFLLVELAGTTQQEAVKLISQQGKFEAKIGEQTVFSGADIKQVVRSSQQGAGIQNCGESQGGWACQFVFPIVISPEAAKLHAEITSKLSTIFVGDNEYLEKKLDLYLDDELVDSLYISTNLKGLEETSFSIEGPGTGNTEQAAFNSALGNMKKMQTILVTGSLPVKLSIAKIDIISPALGAEFLRTAIIAIIAAVFVVGIIIAVRYRKAKIAIPIMLTSLSEVFIIFGAAALIKQNLDLASIAGILATIGTGVDAQLVITDEVLGKMGNESYGWAEKLKRAFFIIMGSYMTVVAAMIPLLAIGAGMLKGFALVTIIGASIGVFVTRPAYAQIIETLVK